MKTWQDQMGNSLFITLDSDVYENQSNTGRLVADRIMTKCESWSLELMEAKITQLLAAPSSLLQMMM